MGVRGKGKNFFSREKKFFPFPPNPLSLFQKKRRICSRELLSLRVDILIIYPCWEQSFSKKRRICKRELLSLRVDILIIYPCWEQSFSKKQRILLILCGYFTEKLEFAF